MTSPDELPEALRRFVVTHRGSEQDIEVLDLAQAAARLQESPTSIERWIADKRLLAWREDQTLRIPAEQIMGPHRIVPGIERVLEGMPSPRAAWDFLRLESAFFPGEPRRPLDALKAGQIEDVIHAIRSHGEAFT